MMIRRPPFLRALGGAILAATLAACGGGGGDDPDRGSLSAPPTVTRSVSASALATQLAGSPDTAPLLALAGTPRCGVEVLRLEYHTVGGRDEDTRASAALMRPTGSDPRCSGPRPVLLHAHGTSVERAYNLASADPANPAAGEALLIATMYAAQGYLVVAPNYAGYDSSPLPYHPYLNARQQSADMVDALAAAREALRGLPAGGAGAGPALFLSGYSQGGHVALATHRALQAAGQTVTASAGLSAPSAIGLLIDQVFSGLPALGGTGFATLLVNSWQRQFGDLYRTPGDIFEANYARTIEDLLPTAQPLAALVVTGQFPATQALFPADGQPGLAVPALAPFGFYGPSNLIRGAYLSATAADIAARPCPGNAFPPVPASLGSATPLACEPGSALRRAARANDLRDWAPARPVLLCGGAQDPSVNFASTLATAGYFASRGLPAGRVTVLDLEAAPAGASDPYAAAKLGFAQAKATVAAGPQGSTGVVTQYHGGLVPPFCTAAARGFFDAVLASGQ